MNRIKGVWGQYAKVDLTTGSWELYEVPQKWYEIHLGGRGIGTRIAIEEVVRRHIRVEPLGDSNLLIFGTGPLQGTGTPGSRHVVMGWSPKTRTLNESYAGGWFGYMLGRTGFDGLIITGQAQEPVYLLVQDRAVEIMPAKELWGMTTAQCDKVLRDRYGRSVGIACIGPAGEQQAKIAAIIHDRAHAAARPGFGAVMGAKRLKAIVVLGRYQKPIADKTAFRTAVQEFVRLIMQNPAIQSLSRFGTAGDVNFLNQLGILPTRNFLEGSFYGADKISGERIANTILVGRDSCAGCPVRCDPLVETSFMGEKVHRECGGPEYETIGALGSLCLVDNIDAIALANQKCNEYGLDTISVGVLIAHLMEGTERGVIKDKELQIQWGDARRMIELIDAIGMGNGVGRFLGQGLAEVSRQLGTEDFAVHIKNVEVPLHEPRGKKGLAISYATSPRGATHLEAMHDTMLECENPTPELGVTKPVNRLSWGDKPRLCKIYEDLYSFVNSCILCGFVSWDQATAGQYYPFPVIRRILTAVTGIDVDTKAMLEIGERNYAIRRIVAAYDGYKITDDDLPQRLKEPLKSGACKGEKIDERELRKAIDEYYKLRGFDMYGPTDETLQRLVCAELVGIIKRPL